MINASRDELLTIDEIGEVIADSITFYFGKHHDLMEKFREIGISPKMSADKKAGALSGKKFVLTGTLPTYSRQEASEIIEEAGGAVTSAVSKETVCLAGENAGSNAGKGREARRKNYL